MSSCFSVILEGLPAVSREEIVVGLQRNYCGINADLNGDRLALQSSGHSAKFLEAAYASEAATAAAAASNLSLRSSLYDYLLG